MAARNSEDQYSLLVLLCLGRGDIQLHLVRLESNYLQNTVKLRQMIMMKLRFNQNEFSETSISYTPTLKYNRSRRSILIIKGRVTHKSTLKANPIPNRKA